MTAQLTGCLTTRIKYCMDELITYFSVSIIAFYLGWKFNSYWMSMTFRKILEDLNITDHQLKDLAVRNGIQLPDSEDSEDSITNKVEIRVEIYQDQYYAYEEEQDTFVAQAKSPEELLERLIDKYPPGTSIRVDKTKGGDLITAAAAKLKEANEG